MFLPSPFNDRPRTAAIPIRKRAKTRVSSLTMKKKEEKRGKRGRKKKKEKKNLMDACTHDRDRASSARERGEAIRYPGNRCPGPVVA